MSQKTSITLTDGASTPVARVFKPARKDGDIYTFHNRAIGIGVGYDALSFQSRLPSKSSKATVVSIKLVTPILEQTSPSTATGIQPAPSVAYNCIGKFEFVLPERCTTVDRNNLIAMMIDLLSDTAVMEPVVSLDPTYF